MDIEKQVVSLSLAKQLKEAGYPQEGVWWWYTTGISDGVFISGYDDFHKYNIICVAPTVAELGEALPKTVEYYHSIMGWRTEYWYPKSIVRVEYADSEADARAKMWLYLKKNNLL